MALRGNVEKNIYYSISSKNNSKSIKVEKGNKKRIVTELLENRRSTRDTTDDTRQKIFITHRTTAINCLKSYKLHLFSRIYFIRKKELEKRK